MQEYFDEENAMKTEHGREILKKLGAEIHCMKLGAFSAIITRKEIL